ncbi:MULTISPECIES: hypothetical protein [Bifidobacterium]|uniref:Uncharacterized protein n=2 Tax=Bifidobacterium TaxID=1678 RepID=A0A261FM27_9BIFI|nr:MULTISPECIES: hypothetical protein [Bifidobacterium]OZG60242.1 hypothetical protein BLEM_1931 [Bifidobacterium lemurum]OZG69313.1 hypothetical protein BEUL_0719 [Bifidobacterium eulemuris]QOL31187.1 hypothetical protein BE0216_00970 [Bifidobacterium eulemuris]QOL34137.1 hypothetical protein BL8807_10420 [Bifidobacterium lemurum]
MSTAIFDPKPMNVDADALRVFSGLAKLKGMTPDEYVADWVNSFKPATTGVSVIGEDEDGPIFDIPDALVYQPRYDEDGAMILPKSWKDDDD